MAKNKNHRHTYRWFCIITVVYGGIRMPRYKIADLVFKTNHIYKYTPMLCQKYLYDGEQQSNFEVTITQDDIDFEKEKSETEFPDFYLESLALFRKINDYAVNNANGIIFHSSAISVDGKGYLFTAKSGTGKSTHARIWREILGDKVVMVNDDKPIIRYVDGDFYVYGTPWNGKHQLDTNMRAKIEAICEIRQAKENKIEKVEPFDMLMVLFNQTVRPTSEAEAVKYLDLLDLLLKKVRLYRLDCNISKEAGLLSIETLCGKDTLV